MLPSITAPTVANLFGTDWLSIEIVVSEHEVRELIPELSRQGRRGHHRVLAKQDRLIGGA